MEYTEDQKAEFKREFAVRRKRQFMLAVPLVAIVLVVTLAGERRGSGDIFGIPRQTFGVGFFLLVAGGLLFSLRNWRCPACDKYLGKGSPHFCPRCGVQLQ